MRDECEAGMIYWNGGSIAAESHLSFGGVKKSGNGFPSAARTFRAVTHEVSWTVNHADSLTFPQGMKQWIFIQLTGKIIMNIGVKL